MSSTVLLMGARGQLGQDLDSVFSSTQHQVVAVDHAELDISNQEQIRSVFEKVCPSIVINAAAYNAVEKAGAELSNAYAVNAFGPYFLATAAKREDAVFVHISTDYVFGGEEKGSYVESDRPFPLNVYGASKLAGEQLVQIATDRHYIIRTSALFGPQSKGSQRGNFVINRLRDGMAGHTMLMVDDQRTVPTHTRDVAMGILRLVEKKAPYGIYHLVSKGSASWYEFAEELFRQRGVSVPLKRISTEESNTQIRRPRSSVLVSEKCTALGIDMPTWQGALAQYLARDII